MTTRTEMVQPRPSVSGGESNMNPIIEDQIRDYRLGSRIRYEAQRRLPGRSRHYRRSLESQLSLDAELNLSQYCRAQQVPAEVLYQAGWSERNYMVYQHYSEERVLVTEGLQVELPFITDQSYNQLVQEGLQHLHIGLVMVRLYTLHRRNAGVNALGLFRDTRWRDDKAIISSMEMDLSTGTQLVYAAPDMTLSIHDFRNHIQLVLQTHGYEGWQGGESNLLLSRSLIGRLSNTSHTNYRYSVQNVADHLTSRGVRAIPGQAWTTADLQGRQWIIRPAIPMVAYNPQTARIRSRTDGSLSVRFSGYTPAAPAEDITVGENDEEALVTELALMMTCDWDDSQESPEDDEDFAVLQQLMALQDEDQNPESGPVWDDSDDDEDDHMVNPFAKGGGGMTDETMTETETALMMEDMEYPLLRKLKEQTESAFSTASSSITRPLEAIMGPQMYPPGSRQPPQMNIPEIKARVDNLRGGYARQQDGKVQPSFSPS